jgi:hypothetical protein
MSQENVEVIMRAFEAARDDPEEFFGILDENVEWALTRRTSTAARGSTTTHRC